MMYGDINSILLAHATDEKIRHLASSGGFIKAFLCDMIDKGYKAIITRMDGLHPETITTTNKSDILDVRTNSCYQEHDYIKAVKNLPDDKYVAVGLGCHVKYLRAKYPNMLIIGLLCNHTPKFEYTKELIRRSGVHNARTITYRGYGWPGKIKVNDKEMDFVKNWSEEFKPAQCLGCKLVSREADIVCADAWGLKQPNKTLVICRNDKATKLVTSSDSITIEFKDKKTLEDSQFYHFKKKMG